MPARRVLVLLPALVATWLATAPAPAAAFGTINGGGQSREHERITRAALACAGDAGARSACFEPRSADYLAGHDHAFGAVGAPDSDEMADPAAHCDGADFVADDYPRTREAATRVLRDCVTRMRTRFREAVDRAAALLDDEGGVIAGEVDLGTECSAQERAEKRAKCASLGAFGRVLHGVQDFYSHSNWSDEADPSRPVGEQNPPGLNRRGVSPVLDLRTRTEPAVPEDLTTGCYVLQDRVPGVGPCQSRVAHAALNKDRGLIDPATGKTADPTTPRGAVGDNFANAVAGAVADSRRQWRDLRQELTARYGRDRGARMACALSHDDPATDCRAGRTGRIAVIALVAGVALVAGAMVVRRRTD
ncbi:CinY protein [Jidongwangia harbinensis]|uniref:CinY protein n=1 Tax=Jidongwangia harbinensis TaxID=2878561 RepID=UPI001CD98D0B|nr:CinY protein [Jidongwangia harbinensis]MCA2217136.1 CinY protein [Jidongwangia harbinensis]